MEYSTPLSRWPEDIRLPEHWASRLRFDADARRLRFSGFMNKCDYDELVALNADSQFQSAIEQLFVLSSAELETRQVRSGTARAWVAGLLLFLATCGAAYALTRLLVSTDSP